MRNIYGYESIDEAYLLANYAFTSDNGRTVIFYREYNGAANVGEYTEVAVAHGSSVKLKSIVSKTGVYEFIEFDGNGSRKFYVYADYYAPTLLYEYTQADKKEQGYIDRYVNGSTIRAGSLTLKEFVTDAGGYTPEYDKHAYLYITNTSGKVIHFMTATELRESGGYTLTEDTVIIYLYDRLGNVVSVTVRANESDLYATATIKDEQMLILDINRSEDEIAIGGFALYKDNVLMDVDFAERFTFYESGHYTVELSDIYGNTYSETFVFQRPLPVVEFQCQDDSGNYVPMGSDVNGSAYVISLGDNAYQVTASTEIRLKYDASLEYEFTVVSGNPTLKHTRSGAQYVRIVDNGSEWTIRIAHKKDPSTYIVVTCGHDTTAPTISAWAYTQEYSWNEFTGGNNVLFKELTTTLVEVQNGQSMNCYSVSLEWDDENDIRNVTLTRDGKIVPMTQTELSAKAFRVSGFGDYAFTVTDILNNTAVFKFSIAVTSGVEYYIDGEKTQYSDDPVREIVGDTYLDTQYTNKDVRIVLTEYGNVSFLHKNETGSGIYQIRYSESGVELYYLRNRTYSFLQRVSAASGEFFTTVSHEFKLNYEIKDGKLHLMFPAPTGGSELWQIRVTGENNDVPTVIQFERADKVTTVRFVEIETGEILDTNENNEEVFSGAKSAVKVHEQSITGSIVKISAYYSEKETFDFYRMDENILYGEGKNISELKDEGYYKIVSLDIYGNSQIVYIRIGFGFEAVVKIIYNTEESVEYSVEKSGSFFAKSNHSVQFTIWAERDSCTIQAEKDGVAFTPDAKSARRYFSFTVSEIGEYEILVDDGCGNVLNFTVSIKAPAEIVYNDYLTGFNEEAPYRDKLYTNGKVNIDYNKLVEDGIKYVYYRVTTDEKPSAKTVIYNLLTPTPAEYKAEDFLACIGKEGNGVYDIVFADEYGNHIVKTVRISDGGQLSVSRLIETSATPELLDLKQVLTDGAWSNHSVILSDSAEASVLKIDGEKVSFTDREYILTFPPAFAEGYETYTVDYMDEYGNRYQFTIHLLKQVVEVSLLNGVSLITVGDDLYAKGDVGYTWTDPRVTAYYTLGTVTAPYENGQRLNADGKYVISFVDYAGNITTKTVCVDTTVSYKLIVGHSRVPDGIVTNEILKVEGNGEALTVVSIKRNGEALETTDLTFKEHGSYEVELSDAIGNKATVSFMVLTHPVTELEYVTSGNFAIAGVWRLDGADRLSSIGEVSIDSNGKQRVLLTKIGSYEVELKDLQSGIIYLFSVEIDRTPPSVTLVGVDEGGSTRENVTLMGIVAGDRVDVYRDGILVYSKQATKTVEDPPSIIEPGSYQVVVSDEAGNMLEYEFVREFTSNAASNIIILMLLFLVGASGFIFLIINGKAKVR